VPRVSVGDHDARSHVAVRIDLGPML
jgi:hypothetical protein